MILVYQMLHGLYLMLMLHSSSPQLLTHLQEDSISNYIRRTNKFARAYTFLNRVINDWNSLPNYIVNADSLTSFKNLLDEHWFDYHYFYDD